MADFSSMNILAIETSCDETAAAVIAVKGESETEILSNIVSSQNEFHKKYGGIVPEIASRKHIEAISPVIKESVENAKIKFSEINAVAVTFGPGLPGSLLVGLSAAKAISFALKIPLIGVNHLEGHIYANFVGYRVKGKDKYISKDHIPYTLYPIPFFPFLCLIVSGGHTQLVLVKDHCVYETIGRTRDDAAGEAFDKIARLLGLGYPGGPIIDELAKKGNPGAINFKRPMLDDGFDFSFSGIKTAVVYYVKKNTTLLTLNPSPFTPRTNANQPVLDLIASFQKTIIETLVQKTIRAAKTFNVTTIALAGGVSANSLLRLELENECRINNISCHIPPIWLCTDNASMIGCVGYFRYKKGLVSDYKLAIESTARL